MKLAAVGLVAVTLSTTALTPAAGTPPWPVTCNVTEPPGPIFAAGAPNPDRVSINRAGCTATYAGPPNVIALACAWPRPGVATTPKIPTARVGTGTTTRATT